MEILLVEDNAADVRLIQEVLREMDPQARLRIARDSDEAKRILWPRGNPAALLPDLLVLDLNLPGTDGRELLAAVRRYPELSQLPVVVLTTSESEVDMRNAYALGANGYIVKPLGIEPLIGAVMGMLSFWLDMEAPAALPGD